jgi:TIR domain
MSVVHLRSRSRQQGRGGLVTGGSAQPFGLFISYRRSDTAAFAGRLYDRFADHFGEDRVFIDVSSIEPGLDFRYAITAAISSCEIVLVLIGPDWLSSSAEDGFRRLNDPADVVRVEIEAALNSPARVIPILIGQTQMPDAQDLPRSLQRLLHLNAFRLDHENFRPEAERLIRQVSKLLGDSISTSQSWSPEPRMPPAPPARSPGREVPRHLDVPIAMVGSWTGTAKELGSHYPVNLAIHQSAANSIVGTVSYPTLGGQSQWELVETHSEGIIVRERVIQRANLKAYLRVGAASRVQVSHMNSDTLKVRWWAMCSAKLTRTV